MQRNNELSDRAAQIEQIVDDLATAVRTLTKTTKERLEAFYFPQPPTNERAGDQNQTSEPPLSEKTNSDNPEA